MEVCPADDLCTIIALSSEMVEFIELKIIMGDLWFMDELGYRAKSMFDIQITRLPSILQIPEHTADVPVSLALSSRASQRIKLEFL